MTATPVVLEVLARRRGLSSDSIAVLVTMVDKNDNVSGSSSVIAATDGVVMDDGCDGTDTEVGEGDEIGSGGQMFEVGAVNENGGDKGCFSSETDATVIGRGDGSDKSCR